MKSASSIFSAAVLFAATFPLLAEDPPAVPAGVKAERDIGYAEPKNPRQILDIYSPPNAKNVPVVVWIHGGGWQAGDKTQAALKPAAFTEKGYVFVAMNYRFVPTVTMDVIVRDVAKSLRWVHDHVSARGGDPNRIVLMGHSAGAQLAALLSTDERYLRAEGLSLRMLKGCVPIDGDTYDIPLQVATAQARRLSLGQPDPKFGHPEKFGPADRQHDFSAVRHLARNKGIPPFLILHLAEQTDTTAQAHRLWSELRELEIPAKMVGVPKTDHIRLDREIGVAGNLATTEVFAFVDSVVKK